MRSSWLAERSPASTSQMAEARALAVAAGLGRSGPGTGAGLCSQGEFLVGELGTEQHGGQGASQGVWAGGCLPVAIPVVLGTGLPAEGYLLPWAVYRWLDGENPTIDHIADPDVLATDLAAFIAALQRVDLADGPAAYRGGPLATQDADTRAALADLGGGRYRGRDRGVGCRAAGPGVVWPTGLGPCRPHARQCPGPPGTVASPLWCSCREGDSEPAATRGIIRVG